MVPPGLLLATPAEIVVGAALVGQALLYRCAVGRASTLGAAEAPTLLDVALPGPASRWLLLSSELERLL